MTTKHDSSQSQSKAFFETTQTKRRIFVFWKDAF